MLIITRGIPGSGKSTWARQQNALRLNRDDLRTMLHGGWTGRVEDERRTTFVQHQAIAAALAAGHTVVADDTNLSDRTVAQLRDLAAAASTGYPELDWRVQDFRDVPLDECLRRNALREGPARIPEDVIRDMHLWHVDPASVAAGITVTDWRVWTCADTYVLNRDDGVHTVDFVEATLHLADGRDVAGKLYVKQQWHGSTWTRWMELKTNVLAGSKTIPVRGVEFAEVDALLDRVRSYQEWSENVDGGEPCRHWPADDCTANLEPAASAG